MDLLEVQEESRAAILNGISFFFYLSATSTCFGASDSSRANALFGDHRLYALEAATEAWVSCGSLSHQR